MPVEAPVTIASWRGCVEEAMTFTPESVRGTFSVRLHHDLDAAVLLVTECLVEVRPLFQRRAMRDHEGGIDLAFFDSLEQRRQIVLHRRLRHAERQPAFDRRAHRDSIDEATIEANDRNRAEVAAAMDRLA